MNPIFQTQQVYKQKQNSFSLADILSGKTKIDPREQVINIMSSLNPKQRERLFGMAQSLANKQGIDISNVMNELKSHP